MTSTNDIIDPTKAGHYNVILSDSLQKKRNKEAFTSIKYNFKPESTADTSQSEAIIHPPDSSGQSYDLSITDKVDDYTYRGTRQSGEGQYVLVFSPERKAFILHQVDSTFNMNVTSTPWDQDQDSLRTTYPHLTNTPREPETTRGNGDSKRRKVDSKPKSQPKAQSKVQAKPQNKAQKTKAGRREPTPPPEEESDNGLTIEYPDGPPKKSNSSITHTLKNEPIHKEEEEGNMDDDERNKDVNHHTVNEENEDDMDLDLDLEAELEYALEKETEADRADESSESEEE